MSDSVKRSFGSLTHIIALVIIFVPTMVFADPYLMLHNDVNLSPVHVTDRQTDKRSVTVGLNENGDLMIRHSDVSLTVAYNPPTEIIDHQERIRVAQRQDNLAISGISLKISLLF